MGAIREPAYRLYNCQRCWGTGQRCDHGNVLAPIEITVWAPFVIGRRRVSFEKTIVLSNCGIRWLRMIQSVAPIGGSLVVPR